MLATTGHPTIVPGCPANEDVSANEDAVAERGKPVDGRSSSIQDRVVELPGGLRRPHAQATRKFHHTILYGRGSGQTCGRPILVHTGSCGGTSWWPARAGGATRRSRPDRGDACRPG